MIKKNHNVEVDDFLLLKKDPNSKLRSQDILDSIYHKAGQQTLTKFEKNKHFVKQGRLTFAKPRTMIQE